MKIYITEEQFQKLVNDNIQNLVNEEVLDEANGVIDERFLKLAQMIKNRIASGSVKRNRFGERNFTIPSNVLAKYNIYNIPSKNLKVSIVDGDRNSSVNGFGNLQIREFADISEIAHELVHVIQAEKGSSWHGNARGHFTLSDRGRELADDIAYDFDPNEMKARITEASVWLESESDYLKNILSKPTNARARLSGLNFNEFYREMLRYYIGPYGYGKSISAITWLSKMRSDIESIEMDSARNFVTCMMYSIQKFQGKPAFYYNPINESPVFGLLMTRPWYLKKIIPNYKQLFGEPEEIGNWWERKEKYQVPQVKEATMWFVVLKGRLLEYMRKSYNEYQKKISKTISGKLKEIYDYAYGQNINSEF